MLTLLIAYNFVQFALINFFEIRKSRLWSPFILISSFYYLFFIVRGIIIQLNHDQLGEIFVRHHFGQQSSFDALVIATLVFPLFYLGYKVGSLNSNKSFKVGISLKDFNYQGLFYINFVLFLIWSCVSLYKLGLGVSHYESEISLKERTSFGFFYILSLIQSVFEFSFYFLLWIYMKTGRHKLIFYICVMIKIYFAAISGGVLTFLTLALAFLVASWYGPFFGIGRIHKGVNTVKMLLLGIITIPGIYFAYVFKELSRYITVTDLSLIEIFSVSKYFLELVQKIGAQEIALRISSRLHGNDSLAVIIEALKNDIVDHNAFYPIFLLLIGFIPRFIYSEKPEVSMGQWFTETLWVRDINEEGFQATAIFIPGDLYLHGGLIGLMVGIFLYGCFLKRMFMLFFLSEYKIFSFVFVSSTFFYFIFFEYTFAGLILTQVRTFLLLAIYTLFIRSLLNIRWMH